VGVQSGAAEGVVAGEAKLLHAGAQVGQISQLTSHVLAQAIDLLGLDRG
jgi:hypothetical protein